MSEDWLRRRLEGLASGGPAAPGDRVGAVLGRARRRTQLRAAAAAVTAAAVVLGATVLVAGGDVGEQGLVAASPDPTATSAQPTASASPAVTATATATGAPQATATTTPGASPTPVPATVPAPRDTSVLRLGFLGDVPGGASTPGSADAAGPVTLLRAWVTELNRRGGADGRPVELLVRDAGSDQGERRRAAQELVDAGVVAVVGSVLARGDLDSGARLLADSGVPLVGGDLGSSEWRTNPLAFAQGALVDEQAEGMLAVLGEAVTGDDRDAAVVCLDGSDCDALEESVEDGRGEDYGLRGTSVQRVSITETNYGPVVQRMKAAGTDVVALQMQWQQALSFGLELRRQNFQPKQVVVQHDLAEELAEEPATDGWYAVQPVFPHVVRDGAAARFHRVGAGLDLGPVEARTWVAAMLVERAVAQLDGARATREALVGALRSLRGERLGGLAPPLDLARSPSTRCVLVARVADRAWTTPQGLRPTCLAD